MKQIVLESSVVIGQPAAKVWEILADRFEDVSDWSSTVRGSGANPFPLTPPAGAATGGRTCTIPGFGATDERFTAFDAAARTFTYSVTAQKMPGFVREASNTWRVRELGPTRCEVTSSARAVTTGLLGRLAGPLLRHQFAGILRPTLEDLRVYAETGRVSPRKQRQLDQAARTAGRAA